MAIKNTADIGFEKEIWKAADLLRGNLDASEYKSVVLGLIFLKYISDRFEAVLKKTRMNIHPKISFLYRKKPVGRS